MQVNLLTKIAKLERIPVSNLRKNLRDGSAIIIRSCKRSILPLAVGKGLRTKINANIGTSPDICDLKQELRKLKVAVEAGADAVMDLSTGGNIDRIRRAILNESPVVVGTVPIYQVAIEAKKRKKSFVDVSVNEIFEIIERHLDDGVDFITVHCGVTQKSIKGLKREPRICGVVSRGGSMMIEWMIRNRRENPLYEYFPRLLKLAKRYQATLSLGDGLRPGSILDATDDAQIGELKVIGKLVKAAWDEGVSVMVEGPGHIPINQIKYNVEIEKRICHGAPFYVLGPLVTDVGAGYDHIVAAIGGALAGYYGADLLCYVTPSEHLGLPTVDDVREGVIVLRIAAHAADLGKGVAGAVEWDEEISKARFNLSWEKMISRALDPARARQIFARQKSQTGFACTMCGEFCAMDKSRKVIKNKK
ncbi:MAG: phosphomethylpyrimidine synthase ThiC [candidate division WOR-3 bacterium]